MINTIKKIEDFLWKFLVFLVALYLVAVAVGIQ